MDRILELAYLFAEIHLGDGDCLGVAARELFELLNQRGAKRPEDEPEC